MFSAFASGHSHGIQPDLAVRVQRCPLTGRLRQEVRDEVEHLDDGLSPLAARTAPPRPLGVGFQGLMQGLAKVITAVAGLRLAIATAPG
jgi:hypothetical protein